MTDEERKSLIEWSCHECGNRTSEVMTYERARDAQMKREACPICDFCNSRMSWAKISGVDPSKLHNCPECGYLTNETPGSKSFDPEIDSSKMCFSCKFWSEKAAPRLFNSPRTLRTSDFNHFYIGDEKCERHGSMRGFGGSRFLIGFHDGRVIKSTNLWSNGTIPPRFRDRLTPNGDFLDPSMEDSNVRAETIQKGSDGEEQTGS